MTGYSEVTLPVTPWVLHNFRMSDLPDGMRRPVSSGMRYAPDDRRALSTKKETGDEED